MCVKKMEGEVETMIEKRDEMELGFFGQVHNSDRNRPRKRQKVAKKAKGKEWLLRNKEKRLRRGKDVPHDSKYTGRKRKSFF